MLREHDISKMDLVKAIRELRAEVQQLKELIYKSGMAPK
jgi:hypothetical protein